MKRIILAIVVVISICSFSKAISDTPSFVDNNCYTVYKIKTKGDYYQIYARQGEEHFKIISRKEKSKRGVKIRKGQCYNFKLRSHFEGANGKNILPMNYLDVEYMYGDTPIKIDGGKIRNLYYDNNINGRYYIE